MIIITKALVPVKLFLKRFRRKLVLLSSFKCALPCAQLSMNFIATEQLASIPAGTPAGRRVIRLFVSTIFAAFPRSGCKSKNILHYRKICQNFYFLFRFPPSSLSCQWLFSFESGCKSKNPNVHLQAFSILFCSPRHSASFFHFAGNAYPRKKFARHWTSCRKDC